MCWCGVLMLGGQGSAVYNSQCCTSHVATSSTHDAASHMLLAAGSSAAVLQLTSVAVVQLTSVAVLQLTSAAVLQLTSVAVLQLTSVAVLQLTSVAVLQLNPHMLTCCPCQSYHCCRFATRYLSPRQSRFAIASAPRPPQ
jgi:hypothetical protein